MALPGAMTQSYGGNTVSNELACVTDVVPSPNSMFSSGAGGQQIRAGVMHDVESPSGHYAVNLATGWLRSGEPHSIHFILDGYNIVQLLRMNSWCWGAGPKVNQNTVQVEQAGYVGFSTSQWLGTAAVGSTYVDSAGNTHTWTAQMNKEMASQFVNMATFIAQVNHHFGWGVPRFGSRSDMDAFLSGANVGCWFSHRMVADWAGGTNHTDTGDHYPNDLVMALAAKIYNGPKPTPPTPPVPTPDPGDAPLSAAEVKTILTAIDQVPAHVWAQTKLNPRFPASAKHMSRMDDIITSVYTHVGSGLILFRHPNGGLGLADLATHTWRGVGGADLGALSAANVPQYLYCAKGSVTLAQIPTIFGKQV